MKAELPATDSVLKANTGALRSSKPQPARPAASTGAPSRASAARREGGVGEFIFIGDSLTGPR